MYWLYVQKHLTAIAYSTKKGIKTDVIAYSNSTAKQNAKKMTTYKNSSAVSKF